MGKAILKKQVKELSNGVNAVAHRDYETASKVQIRIFDDRIEIWSPGLLPEPIKIEDLKREHKSIPRNPLLFKQLFWVKYVEDVGGGTLDMIRECKEWGVPEPEFKYVTGDLVVIFRGKITEEYLASLGLNERQIQIVKYVKEKRKITNKELRKMFPQISNETARFDLNRLVKKKILNRKGKKKGVFYELK